MNQIQGKDRDVAPQVVISFTSYKKRLVSNDIYSFLDSITSQECPGINYRITCTLFRDDVNAMPDKLKNYFSRFNIEKLIMDTDLRSHKKYLMVMQKYRSVPIIIVDDDSIYDQDMVKILYSDHLRHPGVIIGSRVRKISYDKQGRAMKYRQWKFVEDDVPQKDLLVTTGGGSLFPPEFSKLINANTVNEIRQTNTIYQDDFFLHYLAQKNGILTKGIKLGDRKYTFSGGTERCLERGFIKNTLEYGKGTDSLWVRNKIENDKHVHLFNRIRRQKT